MHISMCGDIGCTRQTMHISMHGETEVEDFRQEMFISDNQMRERAGKGSIHERIF